ncbi:hypothetical protein BJX66DRAFT_311181 [Aspergillus keveii]|uniref:Uncharacterized protein n=1 Tax=Aspergillus keveii TaxID=714993 RepID=A0ABR4FVK6_9EURO
MIHKPQALEVTGVVVVAVLQVVLSTRYWDGLMLARMVDRRVSTSEYFGGQLMVKARRLFTLV